MADMVCSAIVQETVSRVVSFALGKREEKASQGQLMQRLEMAVSEMEFALERAQELPIRHLSLLGRRKQIKSVYVEAMELLDKHKQQQAAPARQELQDAHGLKRKRWVICANNMSFTSSSAGLSTDDVRRFEWFADRAGKFVRDVESGCSLHHNTFRSPIVRHLLEGKTLQYFRLEHANLERRFFIWPVCYDERGLEVVLNVSTYSPMDEKCFFLSLALRLSASTDIVGVATKGLQLLTSEFKLAAEYAMGELTLLSSLQDITHSYGPPWVGIQDWHIEWTQCFRPDPACCKGSRHRLCANNNVSSELSDIFPEQVIYWGFQCYIVPPAVEPSRSSCNSFDVVGRSKSRDCGKPRLLLTAVFLPHHAREMQDSYAVKIMGDVREYIVPSIQQVAELPYDDAINCFFRQPELTEYQLLCCYKHGAAGFRVEKASTKRVGKAKTEGYNTRGSTRSSRG